MRLRATAFLAILATIASTLIYTPSADAAVATNNLVLYYDASNPSSYPGSGSTINDLSGGGHTATFQGSASGTSSSFNFTAGANGTSYATVGGDIKGFDTGLTVSFEGTLGAVNNWERIISVGNVVPSNVGLYASGGDGFWIGRVDTSGELAIEGFNNTATTGQCRTSGAAADTSFARWTFTISSSKVCRIYKNGQELQVNINGGASSYGVTTGVALSSASHTVNYLGRSQWSGDSDLGGNIRWIKVYKTALSASEVTDEQTGIVTFNPNGGSGSMANQSSTSATTLTANSLNRPDFTFAGWNTVANGSGTTYSNGSTYSFSDDITLYAQWTPVVPTNSGGANLPTITGTAKVGQTLTAAPGTWMSGTTPTYAYKWQKSSDGLNGWSDIAGATSNTYTMTTDDVAKFVRVAVTATNTAGSSTAANSATSSVVLSENNISGSSGEPKTIGSMFSVPAGSTVYNVTLTSSNLSGAFSLGTTTGLTWVEGYSTTASYMPTSISGTGSIFSFRGTGDAINTALATLKYKSSTEGTDALKMHYAEGGTTSYDIRNYIPIYDAAADAANRLTYHYYGLDLTWPTGYNRAQFASMAAASKTFTSEVGGGPALTSPNNWYLQTSRSAVENTRASEITVACSAGCWAQAGALAESGSSQWYWPASTDGYSSATNVSYTNWWPQRYSPDYVAAQPDLANSAQRSQLYIANSGVAKWDDNLSSEGPQAYLAETYSTTPINAAATTQTFQAVSPADAPASVTVTGAGQTTAVVGWTVPTVNASTAITGYTLKYSTNSSMSGATAITTNSTRTWHQLTGLTANTTYYVTVQATGASWTGTTSAVASGATKSSATTLTISANGGVAGTDFRSTGGAFAPVGTSATVSVSALESALAAGDVILAADTVTIAAPVSWSANTTLTVANSTASTIAINADVTGTGSSAGLNLSSAACNFGTSTGCYSLDVKNGVNITLSGSSPSLKIGGSVYKVLNTKAAFESFATVSANASEKFVIGADIDLGGTTYSRSNYSSAILLFGTQQASSHQQFTGVFDGLGNTIKNYTMQATGYDSGLFWQVNGATVRNVGLTGIKFTVAPATATSYVNLGGLTGLSQGASTFDQVWVTGSMTGSGTLDQFSAGGVAAFAATGSVMITRSWTDVSMNFDAQTTNKAIAIGGIFAGTSNGSDNQYQVTVGGGGVAAANVTIRQAFALGSISAKVYSWTGIGGIMGLNWSGNLSTTLLEDVFYWGHFNISPKVGAYNHGGVIGLGGPNDSSTSTTITRGYTTYSTCVFGNSLVVGSTCYTNVKPGTTGTIIGGVWGSTNGTSLSTVAAPVFPLYVIPTAPSDGSAGTVGYRVVDGVGNDFTSLMGTAGYPTITGTAAWDTISTSTAVGTYAVQYTNGLSLSGTAATSYSLNPSSSATSITLTKQAQAVSWSPTTLVSFGNASFTPSALASASTAITYSVSSAGSSGCSVNATTGVVSYASGGTCSITATAANSGIYLSASKTVDFTISAAASSPATIKVTGAGQTTAVVGWSEPTVTASTSVTGYTVKYSTSELMTGATTINTGSTRTWQQLTGLTANTTYYVTVQATGAAWTGTTSTAVSGSTKSSATALTVSTSGGVSGTDFISTGGAFAPVSSSATISASALQTALASGDVILAADTVTIAAPVNWSNNSVLTLGNGTASTVAINADLNATGTSSGLKLAGSSYTLDTKTGANITLAGASSSLSIGGTAYTLIRSQAALSGVTASGNYALANPITLSNSYTNTSPLNLSFAGTFDGLGNTVNNMTIQPTSSGDYGFFSNLAGATVRNLGITNINVSSSTASLNLRLGALAGNGSSAGTNTITQVWSTGQIRQTVASGGVEAGGLFGGATAGTLAISKSWSSVAVTTYAPSVGSGGIIGTNVSTFGGGAGLGNTLTIDESYSTGNVLRDLPPTTGWYGNGGIIGVAYGRQTTIRNVFSWGNINSTGAQANTSTAGIVGVGGGTATGSVSDAYTVNSKCSSGVAESNCVPNVTAGGSVSGFSTGLWSTSNGASLTNLPLPTKLLYVQVTFSNSTGSYADLGYKIVDSTGYTQDATKLTALGLTVSGTPTYSIASNVAKGSYNVDYNSGLTLGGSSASVYSLQTWTTSTPVTITRLAQSISWEPTTALLRTDSGSAVSAAITTGDSTITYAVTSAGTTGCAINSTTRVLTFSAEGSCTVKATAPQTSGYTEATLSQTFVIDTAPPLAPTDVTVTAGSASGELVASWSAPSTSTTGGIIASYDLEISTDGVTFTSVSSDLVATSYTVTGLTNGTGYKFRVRATNTLDQNSAWVTFLNSTKPYAKPINLTNSSISGSPVAGIALTASEGTWDENGNTTSAPTFQWLVSDDGTTNWTSISGATSETFTPTSSQSGKYLAVEVTVSNDAGSTSTQSAATAVVESGLASSPQDFSTTRGDRQISVAWTAPATVNGGTISSYTVQYRTSGGVWATASSSLSSSATSYTLSSLTNGTSYDVRVYAVTAAGAGEAATLTSVIPAAAAINTGAPMVSGVAAVGRSLSTTDGTWDANGSSITGYTYQWQYSTDGSTAWTNISSNATAASFTVTTSEQDKYLRVIVGAVNDIGTTTEFSVKTAQVQTGLAVAPTVPSTIPGDGQLALSWTAPTTLNGGVISDYEIAYKGSSASSWTTVRVGSATASLTLTGLTNAVSYDWKVSAVTAAGVGPAVSWSASEGSTPYTVASNAELPSISGTTAIGILQNADKGTWLENGRTTTYAYQWQISSDGDTFTDIPGETSESLTLTSQSDVGKYLRLQVTGTNAAGSTTAFSEVTGPLESGLANAPADLAVTAGNAQLQLSWSIPSVLNGGVISDYTVEYKKSSDSTYTTVLVGSAATNLTISGLVNATGYDWRVSAVTAAGSGAVATYSADEASTPFTKPSYTSGLSISGTPAVGNTLTANKGIWSENGRTATYSYLWQYSADKSLWSSTGVTAETFTPNSQSYAGTYVRVQVTATNAAGSTIVSSSETTVLETGQPSSVQSLAASFGNEQAVVSWSAPESLNGGSLLGYRIGFFDPEVGSWDYSFARVSASTTTYTATGLTNGTTYKFVVIAEGTGGDGDYSVADAAVVIPAAAPSLTVAPTITGSATVSETLRVSTGSWATNGAAISGYTYQWQSSSAESGTYSDISDATSASYVPTSADVDKFLRVIVTATNLAGTTEAITAPTSAVLGAPANTETPVISGLTGVGQTVSVTTGSWNDYGNAISLFSYIWQRSTDGNTWTDISGQTLSSYTLSSADEGNFVRVRVSARNIGGTSTVAVGVSGTGTNGEIGSGLASAPTSVVATPENESISLTWQAPATLNGGEVTTYRVEYSTDGTNWTTASDDISSGARSYTITSLTNATSYTVRIRALSSAGAGTAESISEVIPFSAPLNTQIPSFTGALAVGETLTASAGTWDENGRSISSSDITWFASSDGVTFTQIGSGSTYVVTAAELGKKIRITETATNEAGATTADSTSSDAVQSGVASLPQSFTAQFAPVTMQLSWSAPTSLSGASDVIAYRVRYSTDAINWTVASDSISPSATTYEFSDGLTIGTSYFIQVSAVTLAGVGLDARTSSAVLFGDEPSASVAPSILGSANVLDTLTAVDGTWSGNGSEITATTYQWQRSGTGTDSWMDITGATSSTYALTENDADKYVRVIVTKTNSIGQTSEISSASTQVGAGPASPPRGLSIERVDSGLRLSWQTPAHLNGGSIADYTVEYSNDSGQSWTTVTHTPSADLTREITGLTEAENYIVRVRAETIVSGEWATSSPVEVIGAPQVTQAPTVSGSTLVGEELTVTSGIWDAHGAAIMSYSYQWQSSANGTSGWSDIAGATSSTLTLSDALLYYRVLTWATNEAGRSVSSSASQATAFVVSQRASAPGGLTVLPGDQVLNVSWDVPTQLGGGTISNYVIEYSLDDGDSWIRFDRSSDSTTTAQISSLTNGVNYYVRVAAETTVLGRYSMSTTAVVPYGAPINTAIPVVSGTQIKYASTIYATSDEWAENGRTLAAKTYQWQSSSDNGQSWSDISGATSSSYRIGSYVGKILRVRVTQSNTEGLTTSAYSSATSVVVAIAAGAPQALSVTAGDSSISLAWSEPTAWGGSALNRYEIEYAEIDSSNWQVVSRGNATARTEIITGLTNGVQYTVRVRTITDVSGGFAMASTVPYGAAINTAAPTISGTARFDSVLTATAGSWAENGSAITLTEYQWQASADGGANWTNIFGATDSTYTVGSYVGNLVRVQITATNDAGESVAYSSTSTAIEAAGPRAPSNLAVISGDEELSLSWSAPTYEGGAAISDYEVQYSLNGSDWSPVSRTPSSSRSQIITSLSNATAYYIRVRALNGALGNWVWGSTTYTPYGAPLSTAIPVISGTVTFGQTLSSTAGLWNSNGSAISATTYQWQYSTNNGSSWNDITGAQSANYVVGDHVGHVLRAVVSARNGRDISSHASLVTTVVAADTPSAPRSVVVTPGDGVVDLSWTEPEYVGGAEVTDYNVEYSEDGTSWTRATRTPSITGSHTVTGLLNGTEYFVRIRAVNGADGLWQTLSESARPFGLPFVAQAGDQPPISGSAVYGQAMTVSNISWNSNGSNITSTSYRWQVENSGTWSDISGATSASYVISGNIGHSIRAVITSANAAGSTEVFSPASAVIVPGAASSPRSLNAVLDDESAVISWLAPTSTGGALIVDYEVQYSEDGDQWLPVSRSPSTTASERITGLTNGVPYYVRIRALNGSNGNWAFLSNPVIPRGLAINTDLPEITGAPQFQGQMSVDDGQWSDNGDSVDAVSYQWQSSSNNGRTWTSIPGATQSVYRIGLYVGSTLRAAVSARNDAGVQTVYTAPTAVVTAIPAATPVVTSQQISSNTVRVGWTPPIHSGGADLVGYTLQYSADSSNWISLSFGARETTATLSGLTNGTGYFVRVRAETNQSGEWSPIAGPFTPVAPIQPVIPITPAVAPAAMSRTLTEVISPLLSSVMPRSLATTTITSLTGPTNVTITEDGRIELVPTQTVALVDGQPVDATVSVSGSAVMVKTDTTSLTLDFGGSSPTPRASSSTGIVQGDSFSFTGNGFTAGSPVVTWIQSDPIKLSEALSADSGRVKDKIVLPKEILPGEHTIQVNGLDVNGQIVSIIYGVSVHERVEGSNAEFTLDQQVYAWLWALFVMALVVIFVVVLIVRRRVRVSR